MHPPQPAESSVPRRSLDGAASVLQRIALLDVSAKDAQVGGVMTICMIAFVGLLLHDAAPSTPIGTWIAAVVAAALARAALSFAWRRMRPSVVGASETVARRLRAWESAYAGSALFSGVTWGSLAFAAGDTAPLALPSALVLTLALIVASTSSTGNRLAQVLFVIPIVFAQEFHLARITLTGQAGLDSLLAVLWLVIAGMLFAVKRKSSSLLRASISAQIDHERRASEQAALIESAPLGIVVIRDGRVAICNDAALRLFGYARKEDLLGTSARALVPDESTWSEILALSRAAIEGPAAPRVVRHRKADGTKIDVLLKIAAVKTSRGEVEFIGLYEDVVERLAAEESHRYALRMQRLVFESAGEGIAIINDGVIEQANQALADLVGLSTSQLVDRPLQSIFEDPAGWAEIEGRFQRLHKTLKLERRVLRSDGRAIWVSVTGRFVDPPADTSTATEQCSIWILADLSLQKQKEAENWHHANHDMMTGLPNRRFIQDRLDQAIASARRDGRRVAAVELDLDGFKAVNDSYGHRFGDAVLEEVARRLSTIVRELDTVGRWGGDEFVLVLREIDSREVVEETVKRVIARLSETVTYGGHELTIGASIGIALFPDHGDAVETLMLAADLAMYESKGAGGNSWRFASANDPRPRGKYRPSVSGSIAAD